MGDEESCSGDSDETKKSIVSFYLTMALGIALTCIGIIHFTLSVRLTLKKAFNM